jgi:hypothetical protein
MVEIDAWHDVVTASTLIDIQFRVTDEEVRRLDRKAFAQRIDEELMAASKIIMDQFDPGRRPR